MAWMRGGGTGAATGQPGRKRASTLGPSAPLPFDARGAFRSFCVHFFGGGRRRGGRGRARLLLPRPCSQPARRRRRGRGRGAGAGRRAQAANASARQRGAAKGTRPPPPPLPPLPTLTCVLYRLGCSHDSNTPCAIGQPSAAAHTPDRRNSTHAAPLYRDGGRRHARSDLWAKQQSTQEWGLFLSQGRILTGREGEGRRMRRRDGWGSRPPPAAASLPPTHTRAS